MPLASNPLDSPESFDKLKIGSIRNPGIARLISGGGRPYKWDVKDASGQEGATMTYRGLKVAGNIMVRFEFWEKAQIDEFYRTFHPLLKYDATKQNPQPVDIFFPQLNSNEIMRLVTAEVGPLLDLGQQLWAVTVEFSEFRTAKKKNVTTTPTSSKSAGPNGQKTPTVEDQQDREIASLLEQWKKPLPGS